MRKVLAKVLLPIVKLLAFIFPPFKRWLEHYNPDGEME